MLSPVMITLLLRLGGVALVAAAAFGVGWRMGCAALGLGVLHVAHTLRKETP